MRPLISLADALAAIRSRCAPLAPESVPLAGAAGRVLASAIHAARDLPGNDISMMDGYALRAAEAAEPLRVVCEIAAGDPPRAQPLGRGEAARIFTGAPVPAGADCVVMQEHVAREGDRARVAASHPPKPGQHVRRRGEEVGAGAEMLPVGTLLGPAELALAAACEAPVVRVHRRPRIALLPTGDELVPLGREPGPGKLVETNSVALAAQAREAGAEPIVLGIAKDDTAEIAARLRSVEAELLVTTGGASVGDHDHAQAALESLGGELIFHTVAIRPGKPILFGTAAGGRLVFGLPGNPAAAMLGFELFVRLAARLLAGDPHADRTRASAVLQGGGLARVPGFTFFPRGRAAADGDRLTFTPSSQQSSMQIGSWMHVNAIAKIPPGEGKLSPGEEVEIVLLGAL